jgi:DNA-binding YbaB/EbfC family protein
MGTGYSKRKKQAKMMQEQIAKMQEELKNAEFTGKAGNGLVTIILNGEGELLKISIKPECVDPEDVEGLEDLIKAAHQDAAKQIADKGMGGMGDMSGMGDIGDLASGLGGLPGMGL